MPQFEYVVLDQEGRKRQGILEAPDRTAVIDRLQQQGHIAVHADLLKGKSSLGPLRLRFFNASNSRLTRAELVDFTRELATMMAAGQDLDRALRFLEGVAPNKRVAALIVDLKAKIRGGTTFAAALQSHPQSFSELYVGLVRAGEAGGSFPDTLDRLATMLEAERKLRAVIVTAMIYPTILMVVAGAVITLLLTIVLPQFIPLFTQNGVAVPAQTQFLIAISTFIRDYWPFLLLAAGLIGTLAWRASKQDKVRLFLDDQRLKFPVIGKLSRESLAARFTRSMGTLLINGLPIIQALNIAKEAIDNKYASRLIAVAAEDAKAGGSLARALQNLRLFPNRTIHLLLLGEETGQLAAMAIRAAEIHEEQARLYVQRLVALLVPAVTLVMGVIVAGIVASLLFAMLSLNDLAV